MSRDRSVPGAGDSQHCRRTTWSSVARSCLCGARTSVLVNSISGASCRRRFSTPIVADHVHSDSAAPVPEGWAVHSHTGTSYGQCSMALTSFNSPRPQTSSASGFWYLVSHSLRFLDNLFHSSSPHRALAYALVTESGSTSSCFCVMALWLMHRGPFPFHVFWLACL